MEIKLESSWKGRLSPEFGKPYFGKLIEFVKGEYATQTVYPPGSKIFYAFDACPFDQTRVVILGQDPYHGPGQAHGLAFSSDRALMAASVNSSQPFFWCEPGVLARTVSVALSSKTPC